jgi:hypothetical protein
VQIILSLFMVRFVQRLFYFERDDLNWE